MENTKSKEEWVLKSYDMQSEYYTCLRTYYTNQSQYNTCLRDAIDCQKHLGLNFYCLNKEQKCMDIYEPQLHAYETCLTAYETFVNSLFPKTKK